jgi:TfoX/Sxy family transcriptional regulator of competence genes
MSSMPKPSAEAREAFEGLVPEHPAVTVRPMFGNVSAFVNGNMFTGLFGEDLFVRVPDANREELLAEGGADFSPMPGRPMRGYVMLPAGWRDRPEPTRRWIDRSLEFAATLPPKEARKTSSRKARS